MFSDMRSWCSTTIFLFAFVSIASAHSYITYPGWRGNNLFYGNGSTVDSNGLARGPGNIWPYGMQWEYPCGGMGTTTNRTVWPVGGGAVAFEPGWFPGHYQAVLYINLGIGTSPPNMSNPMLGATGIIGPTNDPYPGPGVCFPQVPTPANYQPKIGDNATIQVVMLAQHGAALYSCVDITFADPADVPEVNGTNCKNSSEITMTTVFATTSLTGAGSSLTTSSLLTWMPLAATLVYGILL